MAITDDFNRASLGANWEAALGTIWVTSGSTILQPVSTYSQTGIIRTESAFPDDQYAQIVTEVRTDGTSYTTEFNGPVVRGDSSGNGYFAYISPTGLALVIRKRVAGVASYVDEGVIAASLDTPYTVRISVAGTTIKAYLDGVEKVSTTDSDLTSGKPGVRCTTGAATNFPIFDDFECTDAVVSDPWAPELPALEVDTTLPTGWDGTANATPANGAALQTALDNAVQNAGIYIIQLTAGATYTTATAGGFKVNNKSGTDWLIIRTSAFASLPATGTRVLPADAGNMAKIKNTGTDPAIWFENAAHNIRFVGVEITTDYAVRTATVGSLVYCGYNPVTDTQPSLEANLPSYITFDRCYLHGTATGNIRRALYFDPKYGAVIDSYISDFHEDGADSQAIFSFQGGPLLIHNNYLEGAGENLMIGGKDPAIADLVPSDITITNNHFYKPRTWKSDHGSYAGIGWDVKNLLELKNAQRVLINGNVLDGNWPANQPGYAIQITPRNQDNTAPWSIVQDVTFSNNIVKGTLSGISLLTTDTDYSIDGSIERIDISNNLIICDPDNYDLSAGVAHLFQLVNDVDQLSKIAHYIQIRHNTALMLSAGVSDNSTLWTIGDAAYAGDYIKFQDNIGTHGTYGVAGGGSFGTAGLNAMLTNYTFNYNVMPFNIGSTAPGDFTYPANNYKVNSYTDIGFTDYDNGDYSLLPSSQFYAGNANDGSDNESLGVDWDELQAAIEGTVNGEGPTIPVFTSANSANVAENTLEIITLTATGNPTPTFAITGGADAALLEIVDGNLLRFKTPKDYENPTDSNTNNVYVVTITASNSEDDVDQTFSATVVNLDETANTGTTQSAYSSAYSNPASFNLINHVLRKQGRRRNVR